MKLAPFVTRRRALLAGALLVPGHARPRTIWPRRTVRLRSAYPPGGVSDEVLRALAARLSEGSGQTVQVDHLPGAGGTLAMEWLARASDDGHDLVFSATSPLTVSPHVSRVRYDALRQIQPLLAVMEVPLLVAGTPALRARSLAEGLGAGTPLRWASSGLATTGHLALEAVRLASGAPIVHIPYKGGGQQISDALAGQFEILSSNVAPAQLALVRQGRLKALAVGAPAALPALPGVPTLAEAGFADANLMSTFGLFAPGSTPADVLDAAHRALLALTRDPGWQARLMSSDNLPLTLSRADFIQRVHEESRHRAALVRRLGDALAEPRR